MSRSRTMLERLPAHLEASRPGKLLGSVTAALARNLDTLAAQLAGVRRSHRLGEADELADLLALAALHRIVAGELDLLPMRFARIEMRLRAMRDAASRPEALDAAEALLALWGIDVPTPQLAAFALEPAPDLTGAAGTAALARLETSVAAASRHSARLEAARARVVRICARHLRGNGTVTALLEGAAAALDLELGPIEHSADRFLHAAFAHDRLRLTPPPLPPVAPGAGSVVPPPLPAASEVLGLVENPLRRAGTDAVERRSGELFDLVRRGFERALLQVRITGAGEGAPRTIGPMLVNRDEGHGIGYAGTVPPGSLLVFDESGRATLDGADVTARAFAFKGAVFADVRQPNVHDFGFDGTETRFAEATPAGALDRAFSFPHGGEPVPVPGVAIGVTRFAFFVADAHFAAGSGDAVVPPTPRPFQAVFDDSLFTATPGESGPGAARMALSWIEHEAYKLRLVLPPRFRALDDDPEATELRRRVVQALDRFRPAGVALEVGFVEERWVLGDAVLGTAPESPVASLAGDMVLWPAPQGDGS